MAPGKSRSGPIRQAIGPRKAHLNTLIRTGRDIKQKVLNLVTEDAEANEALTIELEELVAKLESSVSGLQENEAKWLELIENLDPEEVADEDAVYQQFVAAPDNHLVALDEGRESVSILQLSLKRLQTNSRSTVTKSTSNGSSVETTRKGGASKLPKLILPEFHGDVLVWSQFWAIFEANIHNTDLRGVEKLTYLLGQLRGPALETIEGLEITDESYSTAVDLLNKRFKRTPEKVINNLYSQLKRMPISTAAVDDLQKTFDVCERLFRQLKTEGEDIDANRSLVMDIISKYPPEVLTELSRRHSMQSLSTAGKVQTALREYIDEARSLQGMLTDLVPFGLSAKSAKSKQFNNGTVQESRSGESVISSALTASGQTAGGTSPKATNQPCYFCGESHFNSQCHNYSDFEGRGKRLEQLKRCRRCLSHTHQVGDCRTKPQRIRCFFCDKSGLHVSPLCPKQFPKTINTTDTTNRSSSQANNGDPETTPKTSSALYLEEQSVLSTAVAMVIDSTTGCSRRVRIILDSGSHRTYITEALAKELNLSSKGSEPLNVAVFGSKRSLSVTTQRMNISLQLRDGSTATISAHTTPIITSCSLSPGRLPSSTLKLISSMRDAMADDFEMEPGPPDVLIGSDYFWEFITGARMQTEDGIYLIPSKFGLILGGRFADDESSPRDLPALLCLTERQPAASFLSGTSLASSTVESVDGQVLPDIDEFWSLEKIGISDSPLDDDDAIAQQRFNDTVSFKNGRYHVSWPWKKDKPDLPTNYQLALGRFRSLGRRLKLAENNINEEYNKVIEDQIARGIIEEVPVSERWSSNNVVHYLPHHPVLKVNSDTTKVRVVYDASAKVNKDQPSLNECMYRGPVILPDLCAILLRFRIHKVGMVSDIEKAFLQISLHEEERDATRFLWFKDSKNPDVRFLTMYRFVRVPFGVISSMFLLAATVKRHLTNYHTPTADLISKNIYVDNSIIGSENAESGLAVYKESKKIFEKAGMNLREWSTNSPELKSQIPVGDRASKSIVKVLGLSWDTNEDTLTLQANWSKYDHCRTKREVLQAIASIYDPLGLFQPCLHASKCFLRDLWKSNHQWDDLLSEDLQTAWTSLHRDIKGIFEMKIPRHIKPLTLRTLVGFADASGDAYAATVYLRTASCNDFSNQQTWSSTLVFSKSRLAPRKGNAADVSLPRLELLGVVIATRAVDFVRKSLSPLDPIKVFILTDSSCVIGWIRSGKQLPVFVSNRVKEIRQLGDAEFHHVSTNDNPADLATRGKTADELAIAEIWWEGPEWLRMPVSEWPTKTTVDPVYDTEIKEIENLCGQQTFTLAAATVTNMATKWTPCGIDPSKYSSFQRLVRVTVWCLRFLSIRVWSRSVDNPDRLPAFALIFSHVNQANHITSDELKVATKLWLKSAQRSRFTDVIEAFRRNTAHSLIKQLSLFMDHSGLIRCGGRMANADLPEQTLHPVLIPKHDPITRLLIRECHSKLLHCGVSHTLSQLRRLYWVPQGRHAVRKVINKCTMCRKFKGSPFALPRMPPWPRQRVARAIPFQFTGLDYLGPINVKVYGTSCKIWVCLFTCLTIRAVHLEPVMDCTSQSFIDCLSRFISRRGCPEEIISDNAPQFRVAKNLLDRNWHKILAGDEVVGYISNKGIRWKFTTELAPWQGGVYERLVGVVKSNLRVGIGRQLLQWSHFVTLLAEVEAIVNSRPITYVHSDYGSGTALRPIDFISELATGVPEIDPTEKPTGGDAGKNLIRYWKIKQRKLEQLWKQWYGDYLLSMRERGQVSHKSGRCDVRSVPRVDEVVIVRDDDAPRGAWKVGRILKLLPSGARNTIRSAELRMPNGQVIRRPLNHLYQLEIPTIAPSVQDGLDQDDFDGFDPDEVTAAENRVHELRRERLAEGLEAEGTNGVLFCAC